MKKTLLTLAASLALTLGVVGAAQVPAQAASNYPQQVLDAAAAFGLTDYCVAEARPGGNINEADCQSHAIPVLVHIPAGTYDVTTQLSVMAGRYLVAESGAVLNWTGTGHMLLLNNRAGVYGGTWNLAGGAPDAFYVIDGTAVLLAKLTIDKAPVDGIKIIGKGGVVLDGVTISNSHDNGVVLGHGGIATIKNSKLVNNGKKPEMKCTDAAGKCSMVHGVMAGTASQVTVVNTTISGTQGYGIAAMDKSKWTVTGGTITGSGRAGLYLETSSVGVATSVVVDKTKANGVAAKNNSKVTLNKCTIKNSARTGVYVESAAIGYLQGSTVSGSGSQGVQISNSGKTGAKFYLRSANRIQSNKGNGIMVMKGSTLSITAKGSVIQANGNHGIYLSDKGKITGGAAGGATITKNSGNGLTVKKGTASAQNLTITANKKSGVEANTSAVVKLTKCTLKLNTSYAAKANTKGKLTLAKCTITGKTKAAGGGKIAIKK
jgi:hypothetical protein